MVRPASTTTLLLAVVIGHLGAGCSSTATNESETGGAGGGAGNPGKERVVFVTSAEFSGLEVGGLDGADARCNEAAQGALPGKQFRAWLSTVEMPAKQRLTHGTGEYRRTDHQIVAMDWNDLVDSEIFVPIEHTETSATVGGSVFVWTGTKGDGTAAQPACNGWGGAGGEQQGVIGSTSKKLGGQWTNNEAAVCSTVAHLYCFEE